MKQLLVLTLAILSVTVAGMASAATPPTVLITGANRGIGIELARVFAAKGYTVIGTARDPADAKDLSAAADRVEPLDVTDAASVAALASRLQGVPIDILVNNAGVFDRKDVTIDKVDFVMMEQTFAVNTLGPLNQINKTLSAELAPEGFTCVVLHPGWVRTDLGGKGATYSPQESVAGLIAVIEKLGPTDNGRFYDFKGTPIPW